LATAGEIRPKFGQAAVQQTGAPMKNVSLLLATLLVCNSVVFAGQAGPTSGPTQIQTQETPQAAKVKAEVRKRGIGEKSRVKAKLANQAEVKGYISKIEEASFAVTDKKTGQTTTMLYADVQKIQGPGLSKGGKIVIVVGVGAFIVLVALGLYVRSRD
jgi:hypothetical protein